jgi:phosphoglycerol geranylgeranyltransferase
MILPLLQNLHSAKKKWFALLIDPDKHTRESLIETITIANREPGPDMILVGGSLLFNHIAETIELVKSRTSKPVFLFPGNALQVTDKADGILLLSLISGRNPDFLIGQQVIAAPAIKKSGIEVIPTGYILINSGTDTSVLYMSNTTPIPYCKNDIAVATAMAGQMLGLKAIYLEAGSGAQKPVSTDMIKAVRQELDIPLIVGGGLRSAEQVQQTLESGADMVVVGSATEKDPILINQIAEVVREFKG